MSIQRVTCCGSALPGTRSRYDRRAAASIDPAGHRNGGAAVVPALVAAAGERASRRFLEFFAANIRNPHTRRAYARAADEFLAWCAAVGMPSTGAVQTVHVATWIEAGTCELAVPNVKQRLAAIRHLFDWLVTGQVVPVNPAASVRGPRHVVTSGQTPVLDPLEARALLDNIDAQHIPGCAIAPLSD